MPSTSCSSRFDRPPPTTPFQQIEQLTCPPLAETVVEENSDKNRYLNIGAIETSRVRLLSSESDYINASWIDVSPHYACLRFQFG